MIESDKFWDKKAEGYAKSLISDEETYHRKLSETQKYFTPDMRVLEFGCGTGTTAVNHGPHVRHIDALDISQSMLDIGRKKAGESNIENITFTRGTLTLQRRHCQFGCCFGFKCYSLITRSAVCAP